jgi:hypothetical protein
MQAEGVMEPIYLALTTAQSVVRAAGIPTVGFADFVRSEDAWALAKGAELAHELGVSHVPSEESCAYLGLSYRDSQDRWGVVGAAERYARLGRQGFEPVQTLKRIIATLQPDVVVCTSSPRAEKAAILAAGELGVPSLCLVDLLGVDEVAWVGRPGYGTAVAVLSASVRNRMVSAGRRANEVFVTGNPAFDSLRDPAVRDMGDQLRREMGWQSQTVVLWASQVEPESHPNIPSKLGDPELPRRISVALNRWAHDSAGRLVVYRMHPSELLPSLPGNPAWVVDRGCFALNPLLAAADIVVSMNSTVALQASLMGKPVVQVLGSIADDSLPLAREGFATACDDPLDIGDAIEKALRAPMPGDRVGGVDLTAATDAVLRLIYSIAPNLGRPYRVAATGS